MIIAHLKVFFRHLLKKKLLTFINIVGLSVGLSSVLLLTLYVQDERAKDHQHPAAEYKYRIGTVITIGGEVLNVDSSPPQTVPLLLANFSEIAEGTRYVETRFYVSGEEADAPGFYEGKIGFADPNIGNFFSFVWRQGDPDSAWQERNSIVLTETLARKYFPDGVAIGKTLMLDHKLALTVTGIIRDPSLDSHIDLVAIAPLDALWSLSSADVLQNWFNLDFSNYVRLQPGVDMETVWPAMAALLESSLPDMARQIFDPAQKPLTEVYLNASLNPGLQRTRVDDVRVLSGIALAILLIACINFVNLATARSVDRQKEIAIRKVSGSGQGLIFLQYMLESCCLVSLALLLAMGITELSLPLVNAFTGKQLAMATASGFWLSALGIGATTALLAGAYPAFYLSGFRPLQIFRQRQKTGDGFFSFRNLLVLFQFAIAIAVVAAGTAMWLQLRFVQERALGFDKEAVLVIENNPGLQWPVFKQQVLGRTDIQTVAAATSRPFRSIAGAVPVRYEGSALPVDNLSGFTVDFDYFKLFDVDIVAGRTFSETITRDLQPIPTDDNPHPAGSVVLNLAMVKRLGWTPESALGKRFEIQHGAGQDFAKSVVAEVIGVVADMYVDSAQRSVVPLFFYVPSNPSGFDFVFFKLDDTNALQQQAQVETIWREIYPDTPANMYLLDGKFQVLYQRESRQTALLALFAALAIFISCLGLIGLVTYATEQRMKEVGVRKVVGASVLQIVMLFSKDFSKLVLIANLLAWPIAYIAMQRWLEQFAYRIDLTPMIFIGSGLVALCIAWVTVGGTAAKAASAKPVLALRYE